MFVMPVLHFTFLSLFYYIIYSVWMHMPLLGQAINIEYIPRYKNPYLPNTQK